MHLWLERRYAPAIPSIEWRPQHWLRRMRTRRRLAELDVRELDDVGLSERDRSHECEKWFWQA